MFWQFFILNLINLFLIKSLSERFSIDTYKVENSQVRTKETTLLHFQSSWPTNVT